MDGTREILISLVLSSVRNPTLNYVPLKRMPAWCDRVLWHTKDPKKSVDCFYYNAHNMVSSSDHKPVTACFHVPMSAAQETAARYARHQSRLPSCARAELAARASSAPS